MSVRSPNPVDKHVGGRIRMRRLQLGMSQEVLGTGLKVSFQQVQKYEKGTNRVGAGRLVKISELLQVPVSFLFEGAPGQTNGGEHAPAQDLMALLSTKDGVRLASAINVIKHDRELVDLVVGFAETVATRLGSKEQKVVTLASRTKRRATK